MNKNQERITEYDNYRPDFQSNIFCTVRVVNEAGNGLEMLLKLSIFEIRVIFKINFIVMLQKIS